MVQVPLGYSPIAVIHSIPNVSDNVLQLSPLVLAGIFQCRVTTWNDVSIAALNPNLT
jgi:ABC-type phosphate transport system substrate-binding protein